MSTETGATAEVMSPSQRYEDCRKEILMSTEFRHLPEDLKDQIRALLSNRGVYASTEGLGCIIFDTYLRGLRSDVYMNLDDDQKWELIRGLLDPERKTRRETWNRFQIGKEWVEVIQPPTPKSTPKAKARKKRAKALPPPLPKSNDDMPAAPVLTLVATETLVVEEPEVSDGRPAKRRPRGAALHATALS